jgi:glycosyltransferase involved in cell wall biosynthesis
MPLLSISIPTYNRAKCLARLLAILQEQAANDPRVEIIVSDNASTDNTREVAEDFLRRGMQFRYVRNPVNVGGDENIRRCYAMCGGKYAWVFGDDDVIAPGALGKILALLEGSEYDLIFLAPYHFPGESDDFLPPPKLWPDAYNVTSDPVRLADLVDTHSDLMFISSVLINQERAKEVVQPDLTSYVAGNIIQLSWILPILKNLRQGLYVQAQWMGQATLNAAGGYDAGYYYGRRFRKALDSWLEPGSPLEKRLINNHLTMWVAPWLDWKWNSENMSREKIDVADPHPNLLPIYGRNFRYWLCVYPLIVLPRRLAKAWAFPWLVRRKLLRLWYQTITPSIQLERLRG